MTPDRFVRMVEHLQPKSLSKEKAYFDAWQILTLLRRQHAAMVRIVKRQKKKCQQGHYLEAHTRQVESYCDMYQLSCDDFLAALAAYKKGTR